MKQQEVFKKIGIIIRELNDQYDYLVSTENNLNDLELELFVANAHFLADHSEVLRKLNLQGTAAPKTSQKTEEKFFEPLVQQARPEAEVKPQEEAKPAAPASQIKEEENPVPHIDLRGDDTGTDYSYIREPEPESIRHQLNLDDIPEYDEPVEESAKFKMALAEEKQKPVAEPVKTEVAEPEKKVAEPVKESPKVEQKQEEIKEEPLTINQLMSAQLNAKANRAAEQPISDLKQAINLNDKLLYIKDLFNGYNLAYSEAIDILNRYNSIEEADKFLKANYAVKNTWESKQSTVDKFYELLKRRYA